MKPAGRSKLVDIYLDNSATTIVDTDAAAAMAEALRNTYGNPSSPHRKGLAAELIVKNARETIAGALKVNPSDIVFTSGGTEANNLAILGTCSQTFNPDNPPHIITTAVEHSSVLEPIRHLGKMGFEVTILTVNSIGRVDPQQVVAALRNNTVLVSVMLVNNEIGTIQPIAEIAQLLKQHRQDRQSPLLHVDAVQALGKLPLQPRVLGVDLMSISAHKLHGPKGIGALYVAPRVRLNPIMYGGDQERGLRPGTENVPGIAGFATAVAKFVPQQAAAYRHFNKLRHYLITGLKQRFSDVRINSPLEDDLVAPHIINISFPHLKGETIVHALAEKNIYVGTGSACHSRKRVVSHVIQAIGTPREYEEGAIRISLSVNNTAGEIDSFLQALKEVVDTLNAMIAPGRGQRR